MLSKLRLSSLLCAASLLLPIAPVRAQIGISPMVIEVKENGGQAQASINAINNTREPFRARVYAEPFTYDRDKGFNTITKDPQSLVPYLKFSPRELNVPAGVTRRVRLSVQLPANLPAGEYRTAILTENLSQQQQTDKKGILTTISTRIAVTMFVQKGDLKPKLSIGKAEWNQSKNQIQLLMNNQGRASAYPQINWTLSQGNTPIKTGKVNPTGIISNTSRSIEISLSDRELKLKPGIYQLSGTMTWGATENNNSTPFSTTISVK